MLNIKNNNYWEIFDCLPTFPSDFHICLPFSSKNASFSRIKTSIRELLNVTKHMLPLKLYLLFINLLDDRNTTVRQTKTIAKLYHVEHGKNVLNWRFIWKKKEKKKKTLSHMLISDLSGVKFDLAKPIRSQHMRLEVYHLRDLVE